MRTTSILLTKVRKKCLVVSLFPNCCKPSSSITASCCLLKKKRKEKETPQVPQNENKSKLLNPPETPRIQKEILCVKGGV